MHHAAVAENESEANGGELHEEDSNDEGECGGLLTEKDLLAIYEDPNEAFVDEILGKGFTGAMVQKGGNLCMVAVQRSLTGSWVKVNTTDPEVRQLLPPRHGCRIERHRCNTEGQQQWQVWYPRLDPDDETEPRSHTVTGPDALNDVMSWAWNKHAKWLAN